MNYMIYALVDPRTDMVRYVGLTSQKYLSDRFDRHLDDWRSFSPKGLWISELLDLNMRPVICLLDDLGDVSAECAYQAELDWINFYRSFLPVALTNCDQVGSAGDFSNLLKWRLQTHSWWNESSTLPARIPDWAVALLGTMPDYKLAERVGCSKKTIMRARHFLGVASYADTTGNSGRFKPKCNK